MSTSSLAAPVKALGEIVLRVRDLDASLAFYCDLLGLPVLRRFEDRIAFLKISDGVEGQTQAIALFHESMPSNWSEQTWLNVDDRRSTLHHFALTIPLSEYEPLLARFQAAGIACTTAKHTWIGWHGIYARDPDGNIVEFLCYDPKIDESATYDYTKLHGARDGKKF